MKISAADWKETIRRGAADLGIEIAPHHLEAFSIHARELLFWNRKSNLTAITDPMRVAENHFVDSLMPLRWIPPEAALLDVGSGGGFPGIPLKVVRPGLSVVLIDAVEKKVSFLKHVIRLLNLSGIEAIHLRAEQMAAQMDAAGKGFSGRFDVIVSRATGPPETMISLVLPMLGENGILLAMLGKAPPASSMVGRRLAAMEIVDAFDYRLPDSRAARSIWCMRLRKTIDGSDAEEGE
ncbi:MAG: 16S rRNA (guanine(527)-N(7))-methyltransferase RsmG [Desulfobacterales bacterium]|jgi:16S rRNA (guanine527-N7)-methyltransferase